MRRRALLAAGLAVPAGLLAGLDDTLAILPATAGADRDRDVPTLLARARKRFDAGAYRSLGSELPSLLAAAHADCDAHATPEGHARLAACYRLATEVLCKVGLYPTSRITADRAVTYARLSGSPIAAAASARVLSIVLRHEERHDIAGRVILDAAQTIEATGLVTPIQSATFARMMCTCAYNAAKSGDRARALDMIGEAQRAAARLGTQSGPRPPSLTPAAITLYQVGVHWALGDSGAALHAGRDLRAAQFSTAERRGRLHTDLARAWWQWGKPRETAQALLAAYREAPAEVCDRPAIRSLVAELTRRHSAMSGVRELAAAASGHRRRAGR